jgi:hypothetical protein
LRRVKATFQFYDACHDLAERRDGSEDHPGHSRIVWLMIGEHLVVRSKREGARSSGAKIEVWPIEEHASISGAVLSHRDLKSAKSSAVQTHGSFAVLLRP